MKLVACLYGSLFAALIGGCSDDGSDVGGATGGTGGTGGTGDSALDAGVDIESDTPADVMDVDVDAGPDVHDAASDADALSTLVSPSVDGLFDEWTDDDVIAVDPSGDATGAFDVTRVWATNRGTALYLRAEVAAEPLNMLAGWSNEGTLIIEVDVVGGRHLAVDLRNHTVIADGSEAMLWSAIGFQIAPTTASTQIEVKLDLAVLGAVQGDEVAINFSGSDSLAVHAPYEMSLGADVSAARDPSRPAGTDFRLASLNVEWDGLMEPGRAEPIGRLLGAVAADVYCLQEVWETTADEIATRLGQIDPHGDGATWNVHRTGDTAVATRGELVPLAHDFLLQPPFTGAGVVLANGVHVMVFTLRPTCCGFIGNPADLERVSEIEQLAAAVLALRDGTLDPSLVAFSDAPVVVVGDWNLVGSTTPLDRMTDPAGPGLDRWLLRHLAGDGAIYTWRNDVAGTFPPGTLDVLAYGGVDGAQKLEPLAGFVLDTGELDGVLLGNLGLQSSDSLATDHLMLVADFGF